MTPSEFFAASSVLSLGGFDPAPAMIAAVFMSARSARRDARAEASGEARAEAGRDARDDAAAGRADRRVRSDVLLFGLLLIGGTVLWGVGLSLLVGRHLAEIPWHAILRAGAWAAAAEIAVAVVGLVFAGYRWSHRNDPPKEEKNRNSLGLMLVALGFVAIVTADLPFAVTVGLSAGQPLWIVIPAFAVWAVVSQSPLFLLCLGVLANRHHTVARWIGRMWEVLRPWIQLLLPLGIAVVCVLLLLDAGRFFLFGRFLIG